MDKKPRTRLVTNLQLHMICDDSVDYPWSVEIKPDGSVYMRYIGYLPLDVPREQHYDSLSAAPKWVDDRVTVLYMMPPDPHESVVFGVGRRINERKFWVVPPRGFYGMHTGGQS